MTSHDQDQAVVPAASEHFSVASLKNMNDDEVLEEYANQLPRKRLPIKNASQKAQAARIARTVLGMKANMMPMRQRMITSLKRGLIAKGHDASIVDLIYSGTLGAAANSIAQQRESVDRESAEWIFEAADATKIKRTSFGNDSWEVVVPKSASKTGNAQGKFWTKQRYLGHGSYGAIWLETCGKECHAVKQVRKRDTYGAITKEEMREIAAMSILSKASSLFPYFYGWYDDQSHLYIVMEFIELGDLETCIQSPLDETQAGRIVVQVAKALEAMHTQGFVHRDLKPNNIFVKEQAPTWTIKLGDFGVSKRVGYDDKATALRTTFHGPFVAPEMGEDDSDESEDDDKDDERYLTKTYSPTVDVWGLGALTHWLFTQKAPLADKRSERKDYLLGYRVFPAERLITNGVGEEARTFIERCLAPHPDKRPTIQEALKDPWLSSLVEPEQSTTSLEDIDIPESTTDSTSVIKDVETQSSEVIDESIQESSANPASNNEIEAQHSPTDPSITLKDCANTEATQATQATEAVTGETLTRQDQSNKAVDKPLGGYMKLTTGHVINQESDQDRLGRQILQDTFSAFLGSVVGTGFEQEKVQSAFEFAESQQRDREVVNAKTFTLPARDVNKPEVFQRAMQQATFVETGVIDARRTLERKEVKMGPDHSDTLTAVQNLAHAIRNEHPDSLEAADLYARGLFHQERELGKHHAHTEITRKYLRDIFALRRMDSEVEEMGRILTLRHFKLGSHHPETLDMVHNLAHRLREKDPASLEAAALYRRGFLNQTWTLGPRHMFTMITADYLRGILEKHEAHALEAANLLSLVREVRLGASHTDTISAKQALADLEKSSETSRNTGKSQ